MKLESKVKVKMIHDTISVIDSSVTFTEYFDEYLYTDEVKNYIYTIIDFIYNHDKLKEYLTLLEPDKNKLLLQTKLTFYQNRFLINAKDFVLRCQLYEYNSYATALITYIHAIAFFSNISNNSDLFKEKTLIKKVYLRDFVWDPVWIDDLFFNNTDEALSKINYTGPIKTKHFIDEEFLKKIDNIMQ